MESNSSPGQISTDSKHLQKIKPIHFLIFFIIFSFIIAFIIGGIFIGKDKTNRASTNEQIKLSSDSIPNNPDKWKTYILLTIGMEIKLPDMLSKSGDWKEQIINGDTGSKLCFSKDIQNSGACAGGIFILGGSSTDFSEGRGSSYTDYQGFEKYGNKISINGVFNKKTELEASKFKDYTNRNGVRIIKILGENQSNGFPVAGTPGEGSLSALINTDNPKYPGVSIVLNIDSGISEYEFDQILESIKFN